jgi:hypothetical protein
MRARNLSENYNKNLHVVTKQGKEKIRPLQSPYFKIVRYNDRAIIPAQESVKKLQFEINPISGSGWYVLT